MHLHGKDLKIFTANSNPKVAEDIASALGLQISNSEVKTFSDGEIAVSIMTRAQTKIQYLSACNVGDKCQKTTGECTVCFPAPTDTLWSVAKKYHKPLSHLMGINTLPPQAQAAAADSKASLAGVNYLLV